MRTIKELRERLFISQEDFAGKAGMSPNTLNRLEKGLQKPRWVTIRKLAEALGVEPGEIDFGQCSKGPDSDRAHLWQSPAPVRNEERE